MHLPPTKASPAPLVSIISSSAISMTGYSSTSSPEDRTKKHSTCSLASVSWINCFDCKFKYPRLHIEEETSFLSTGSVRILGAQFLSHTYTLPHCHIHSTLCLLSYIAHVTSSSLHLLLVHIMHCTHFIFPSFAFPLLQANHTRYSFYTHYFFYLLLFLSDLTHAPFPLTDFLSLTLPPSLPPSLPPPSSSQSKEYHTITG